jgi:tRNA pseudouridine55 synthase
LSDDGQRRALDGVLVVDKPGGLTSHDVVAATRRALGESRIGHTGTLDPMATGVLPLALGRATRLVRFLSASDKDYTASIRFGITTDSYDATGREISRTEVAPPEDAIAAAIRALTGVYLQQPPPFSAKKVGGRRAYALARMEQPVALQPVEVRVDRAQLVGLEGPLARVEICCSAGFYVRAFAHALGELTGAGACLAGLRRTRSGQFTLTGAVTLDILADRPRTTEAIVRLEHLLPRLPAVHLTERGVASITVGRDVSEEDYAPEPASPIAEWTRLLAPSGALVALGTPGRSRGALHPSIVLI